jgi:hypothetical protein
MSAEIPSFAPRFDANTSARLGASLGNFALKASVASLVIFFVSSSRRLLPSFDIQALLPKLFNVITSTFRGILFCNSSWFCLLKDKAKIRESVSSLHISDSVLVFPVPAYACIIMLVFVVLTAWIIIFCSSVGFFDRCLVCSRFKQR